MTDEVTVTQAAEILNVTRQWVLRLINKDKLDARKLGHQWVITRESVEDYKASQVVKK